MHKIREHMKYVSTISRIFINQKPVISRSLVTEHSSNSVLFSIFINSQSPVNDNYPFFSSTRNLFSYNEMSNLISSSSYLENIIFC